ncbi:MAG: class I SAM-dependent methyltransferase [Gammaproteobacteria bacterium]|nr:class I SAM-dependent methyltransferase [Gammaproteobacteria bacterium]
MQAEQLSVAAGELSIVRPGASPKQALRAWDAADEYLIKLIEELTHQPELLIINDQFGALGCACNKALHIWQSDSFCAKEAFELNRKINEIEGEIPFLESTRAINADNKLALIKLPRNTSLLEYQLNRCHEMGIKEVWLAGMMKHLPKTILEQLQRFGTVERLPFIKKATVFKLQLTQAIPDSYPKQNTFSGVKLSSHANVFGRDKLDPGAQFFIDNMSALPKAQNVADLCCGSGILGIKYASNSPESNLHFFDESYMAIESTQASWKLNQLSNQKHFHWADGLPDSGTKFDLILCNPPFHESNTVGDHIAKRLFKQSRKALSANGQLIVVGNRHLKYHITLKTYFKNVKQIAANPKFVLLSANG